MCCYRILESNEQLNDHISSLLHEKNEFLQLHLDQEKQLYEKELYLRQLSSEQESLVSEEHFSSIH